MAFFFAAFFVAVAFFVDDFFFDEDPPSGVPVNAVNATSPSGIPRFPRERVIDPSRADPKIAFSTSVAVALGFASKSRAAKPAMCGVAIDEPLKL